MIQPIHNNTANQDIKIASSNDSVLNRRFSGTKALILVAKRSQFHCIVRKINITSNFKPEKTADISRPHHCFPREMTSEKQVQKFHTVDASLPRSS